MSRRAALAATHDMLRERCEKARFAWGAVQHGERNNWHYVARDRYLTAAAQLAQFELILAEHTPGT